MSLPNWLLYVPNVEPERAFPGADRERLKALERELNSNGTQRPESLPATDRRESHRLTGGARGGLLLRPTY